MTLSGSLALAAPESALVHALTRILEEQQAFAVDNAGIRRLFGTAIAFDVADRDGRSNADLVVLVHVRGWVLS